MHWDDRGKASFPALCIGARQMIANQASVAQIENQSFHVDMLLFLDFDIDMILRGLARTNDGLS